jgi:hypothetical protein
MNSIVINPKDQGEFDFISKLLKKMGIKSKVLSEEEMEDIGLSLLLREINRSETVSEEEIKKKLED